jgi:hypothetical protein
MPIHLYESKRLTRAPLFFYRLGPAFYSTPRPRLSSRQLREFHPPETQHLLLVRELKMYPDVK